MSHKHAAGANTAKRRRSRIWKVLPILGLVGCCFTWVWVGVILDENEERMGDVMVEAEIPFDPDSLPAQPTEMDYYELALDMLDRYQWTRPAHLTLFGTGFPCDEFDQAGANVYYLFSRKEIVRDGFVLSLLPRVIKASVSFNVPEETMTLSIIDGGVGLRPLQSRVDLNGVAVDTEEALQIAERQGGRSFRRYFLDRCDVHLDLINNSWIVVYDTPGGDLIRVQIDATTGKVY
jgi:hypothetical protein